MDREWAQYLQQRLAQQEEKGLLRELRPGSALVDFSSNDYLGLAKVPEIENNASERLRELNNKNGSTGSRLLTGNGAYFNEAEEYLAHLFDSESALIMNSGYLANVAVLSALPQKGDTIIFDELVHASLKDGARLSLAKHFNFCHNDTEDLQSKIKASTGKVFIVTESVFSMDGDECALPAILDVADQHGAFVILDEAHSTGVTGVNGCGLAVSIGLHKRVAVRIYTFGKAMGVHGACIAGSAALKKYIVNFGRPFIYTTSLPPHAVYSIMASFEFLKNNHSLQESLLNNIDAYLGTVPGEATRTKSTSAIQTIIIPGNQAVKEASRFLHQHGIDVRPILSPTVPKGKERLRICLHSFNTAQEIETLTKLLNEWLLHHNIVRE